MPITVTTGYDVWLDPVLTEESSGAIKRTTTTSVDAAGRAVRVHLEAGLAGDGGRPDVFTHYDPATGLVDYTGPADKGAGALSDADKTTVFDGWGRPVSYRSEAGDVTTTSYDSAGRVVRVVDPKGTTTTTWDGADARGKVERRGLPTAMTITRAGADGGTGTLDFTGAYDAAGALVEQHLPGGMVQRTDYDVAGQPVGLSYEGQVTPLSQRVDANNDPVYDEYGNPVYDAGAPTTGTWLAWTQASDGAGRVRVDYTGSGSSFDPAGPGVTSLDQVVEPTGAAAGYDRAYSYDRAGRLVSVVDRTATAAAAGSVALQPGSEASADAPCQVRSYAFDRNGRRIGLTATDHSDGDCAGTTSTASTNLAYAYDTADRPTTAATGTREGTAVPAAGAAGTYAYDAFGRQTLLPAADAPNPAGGDIHLGYYDDDLAHTITQGATTTTLDLDAGGRRTLATTTDTSTTPSTTSTLERHYGDASDNPAWTVAADAGGTVTTTRYGESLGGDLAATLSSDGTASLSLANLHGDVVTTIDIPATSVTTDPATSITGWADYTEYGAPRDPAATAAVAGSAGYGWLGAKQRSTTAETAGLTLMGDRLYNPATGAFTGTDPEPGGNTTAYTYPQDPINMVDLDGHYKMALGGTCNQTCKARSIREMNRIWKAARRLRNQARWLRLAKGAEVASKVLGFCWVLWCKVAQIAFTAIAALAYFKAGKKGKAVDVALSAAFSFGRAGAIDKAAMKGYIGRHAKYLERRAFVRRHAGDIFSAIEGLG